MVTETAKTTNGSIADNSLLRSWRTFRTRDLWQQILIIVASLTALRLFLLIVTDFNLGGDEAQYWTWSQKFQFGYFSKPPMIGWVIATTTNLFGNAEWAVRMASPLLYAGGALFLFRAAQLLYETRTAFWAALTYITLPSVSFSSGLMTTDVPLLFFWCAALFAVAKLRDTGAYAWAVALGFVVGLGFLSKYAMIYFLVGLGLMRFALPDAGRWFSWRHVLLFGLAWIPLMGLNIYWNLKTDFSTVGHTAKNANWGSTLFNFDELGDFLGGQFGVFGPILFIVLLIVLWGLGRQFWERRREWPADVLLACFTLPPLLIISVQSFISRAHANWAATGYMAATVLVCAVLLRQKQRRVLVASLALHVALGAAFYTLLTYPPAIERVGLSSAFKEVRGWDEVTGHIEKALAAAPENRPYTAVMADDRMVNASLFYYLREAGVPVRNYFRRETPTHTYELRYPLTVAEGDRVLYVSKRRQVDWATADFETVTFLKTIEVDLTGGRTRTLHLHEVTGYRGR